ncbi:MAG TPA: alpha-ketoglutarate-dependent dioxygenase AlkB [Sphingomicrobium sp.]|nr:alpha-ketoglutarate-dependent dioxygenase AlkB [Sphingomicrobium sp.]
MLFDAPLVPGLAYRQELVGRDEEAQLVTAIEALDLSPFKFQGWTGKRLTRSFGWRYDFDERSFEPAGPLPTGLLPLRDAAAAFAGMAADELINALITRYDIGAGIGWHRDRPQFGKVVGISLAGSATLRFRQRTASGFRRASLELAPRSAYLLSGEVRQHWEHGIAAHDALRYSITFRTLSERGRASISALPA